jgi:hypothetical protein
MKTRFIAGAAPQFRTHLGPKPGGFASTPPALETPARRSAEAASCQDQQPSATHQRSGLGRRSCPIPRELVRYELTLLNE